MMLAKVSEYEGGPITEFQLLPDRSLSLQKVIEKYPFCVGLRYRCTGNLRAVRIYDGQFHLPHGIDWSDYVFYCVLEERNEKEPVVIENKTLAEKYELNTYDIRIINIGMDTTYEQFYQHFNQFGKLVVCELKTDQRTRKCKGYGFLRYSNYDEQKLCIDTHHKINGTPINLRLPTNKLDSKTCSKMLFISNITPSITQIDLLEYFNAFGKVTEIFMPPVKVAYAIITFASEYSVSKVFQFGECQRVFGGFVTVEHLIRGKKDKREAETLSDEEAMEEARQMALAKRTLTLPPKSISAQPSQVVPPVTTHKESVIPSSIPSSIDYTQLINKYPDSYTDYQLTNSQHAQMQLQQAPSQHQFYNPYTQLQEQQYYSNIPSSIDLTNSISPNTYYNNYSNSTTYTQPIPSSSNNPQQPYSCYSNTTIDFTKPPPEFSSPIYPQVPSNPSYSDNNAMWNLPTTSQTPGIAQLPKYSQIQPPLPQVDYPSPSPHSQSNSSPDLIQHVTDQTLKALALLRNPAVLDTLIHLSEGLSQKPTVPATGHIKSQQAIHSSNNPTAQHYYEFEAKKFRR